MKFQLEFATAFSRQGKGISRLFGMGEPPPRHFRGSPADSSGPGEVPGLALPVQLYPQEKAEFSLPDKATFISQPLERAILDTLLYADIFNFPLTAEEIHRYLIECAAGYAEVKECLVKSGSLRAFLSAQLPYYCLRGREANFANRRNQNATVARHWKTTRRWGRLLRCVPFLHGAIVTGALAAGSARPHDDIDLLLLVEPGRLWACRALVIGLVHLARLRGVELCPNYLMALKDEPLRLQEPNLYSARELAGMRLLFGRAGYDRLLARNGWLNDFLPNAQARALAQTALLDDRPGLFGRLIKWSGVKLLGGWPGDIFEKWERRKIARFNRQEGPEASFGLDICKGHFGNYGHTTLAAFEQRRAIINSHSAYPLSQETL